MGVFPTSVALCNSTGSASPLHGSTAREACPDPLEASKVVFNQHLMAAARRRRLLRQDEVDRLISGRGQ